MSREGFTAFRIIIVVVVGLLSLKVIMEDGGDKTENVKVIYLIRHAQSEENRRIGSLKESFRAVKHFSFPKVSDLTTAMQLFNIPAQVDSDVSELGGNQIKKLAESLQKDNFLESHRIKVVAHSPLKRARQTSEGMLGCGSSLETKPASVDRVIELEILTEKSPSEWIPGNNGALQKRMNDLKAWLLEQPEEKICLVGHSQYFKNMLNLNFLFGNCDVWQVTLSESNTVSADEKYKLAKGWSGLKRLYSYDDPESPSTADADTKGEL